MKILVNILAAIFCINVSNYSFASENTGKNYLKQSMENYTFAKVVESPYSNLNGRAVVIEGTTTKLWGIKNVWKSKKAQTNPALLHYLTLSKNKTGTVYYGKIDGLGHCFHETWLSVATDDVSR